MAKAKKDKELGLKEAAEAFILLYDSGNYSGREFDILLNALREAVKPSDNGPIVPEDYDAEESERGADSAADLAAEIAAKDEAGTLAPSDDGGRKLAAMTKEKAAAAADNK